MARRKTYLILPCTCAALLLLLSPAPAEAGAFTHKFPINRIERVSCALGGVGERVQLFGVNQVVLNVHPDNGNGFHVVNQNHFQLEGVGLTSGERYLAREVSNSTMYFAFDSAPSISHLVRRIRVKNPGGAQLAVRVDVVRMVNANGDVTVSTVNVTIECD